MKTKTLLTALLFLTLTMTPAYCQITKEMPKVKLTALIVDDEGNPIKDADVALGDFTIMNITPNPPLYVEGKSNEKGEFTGEISSFWGSISVRAKKEKYYANESEKIQLYKTVEENLKALETGSWGPVKEPLKVVLRPKKNPISMQMKKIERRVPLHENWIGFDFEIGDYLPPYGKGKIKDMEIRGEGKWDIDDGFDYSSVIRFVNQNDGLIKYKIPVEHLNSEFSAPYAAPAEGYVNNIRWRRALYSTDDGKVININATGNEGEKNANIFRIRTVVDEKGDVLKSMHGNMASLNADIPNKDGLNFIRIIYYLNPDGTRNLEYDKDKLIDLDDKRRKMIPLKN